MHRYELFPHRLHILPVLFSSSISASEWVKITVPETGVYEITYEELREMGFSNPEGVGLIGRGGQPLAINHENDLFGIHPEVPVIHENGRLYFHAFGPESFSFKKLNQFRQAQSAEGSSTTAVTSIPIQDTTFSPTPPLSPEDDGNFRLLNNHKRSNLRNRIRVP